MENDFRPANWIELHDINILIALNKNDEPGWFYRTKDTVSLKQYSIPGDNIAALFEIAGLNQLGIDDGLSSKTIRRKEKIYKEAVSDFNFHIYKSEPTETFKPDELLVCINSDHLVSIKTKFIEDNGSFWVEEFTYSGVFTICWKSEG